MKSDTLIFILKIPNIFCLNFHISRLFYHSNLFACCTFDFLFVYINPIILITIYIYFFIII